MYRPFCLIIHIFLFTQNKKPFHSMYNLHLTVQIVHGAKWFRCATQFQYLSNGYINKKRTSTSNETKCSCHSI